MAKHQQPSWVEFALGGLITAGITAIGFVLRKKTHWDKLVFQRTVSLAVLGMPQSGKTQWYKYLGAPVGPRTKSIEEGYEEFKIKVPGDGDYELTINKGRDITGADDFVSHLYIPMIEKNDIILFFFNSYKFYNDESYIDQSNKKRSYRQVVIDRIALIAEYQKEDTSVFIVPTYKDKLLESNVSEDDVSKLLYKALLSDNSASKFADLNYIPGLYQANEKTDLEDLFNKVFEKYKDPLKDRLKRKKS